MELKYSRVLLKLSGESLAGDEKFGYSDGAVKKIVNEVLKLHKTGAEIAIVVGGGNFLRGKTLATQGVDPSTADYMGMMATIMNALYLRSIFDAAINAEQHIDDNEQTHCRVMTAIEVNAVAEEFIYLRALKHLRNKNIVILGGGTGNPFFTTDTAAVLKAKELDCDVVIKATKIDGIYDKHPDLPGAQKLDVVTYDRAIQERLAVMDATAFTMSQDHNIPIIVCDVLGEDNLKNIVLGKQVGTLVRK